MFPTSGKAAHKGDNSGQEFNPPWVSSPKQKTLIGPRQALVM